MSKPTIYQHYDYGSPIVENTYGTFAKMLKAVLVTGYSEITGVSIEQYQYDLTKMLLKSPVKLSTNAHIHIKTGAISFPSNYPILVRQLLKTENNVYHYLCDHDSVESFPLDSNVTLWKKPLGWTLKFENEALGKYVFVNATGWHLRVHDAIPSSWDVSWAKCARVTLGRDMHDIDTFKEYPTPYSEVQPNYAFDSFDWSGIRPSLCNWIYAYYDSFSSHYPNSGTQNGTRHWSIIGDENTFYLFQSHYTNGWAKCYRAYGVTAIKSNYENDDTAFAIWGNTMGTNNWQQWLNESPLFISQTSGLNNNNNEPHYKNAFIYRTIGQTNFSYPTQCKTVSLCGISDADTRSGRTGWAWDDATYKSISLYPMYVVEKGHRIRGELVGAKWIPQDIDSLANGGHNSNIINDVTLNNTNKKIAIFNFRHRLHGDYGVNYVAMDLDSDWSEHVYVFPE